MDRSGQMSDRSGIVFRTEHRHKENLNREVIYIYALSYTVIYKYIVDCPVKHNNKSEMQNSKNLEINATFSAIELSSKGYIKERDYPSTNNGLYREILTLKT